MAFVAYCRTTFTFTFTFFTIICGNVVTTLISKFHPVQTQVTERLTSNTSNTSHKFAGSSWPIYVTNVTLSRINNKC
jgi:hypothetical protein